MIFLQNFFLVKSWSLTIKPTGLILTQLRNVFLAMSMLVLLVFLKKNKYVCMSDNLI